MADMSKAMTFYDLFAVGIGVSILVMYIMNKGAEVRYVKSDVDGREYLVQKTDDSLEAANMLASLNFKVEQLITTLLEKYPGDGRVQRLDAKYNPHALSEGGHETGYTSYSVNKGEKIVMCIRARNDSDGDSKRIKGAIESENVLMYVLLHELAHLATLDVGHTKTFWRTFNFIIKEAVALGIYEDTDYSKNPVKYCGINIDSSAVTKDSTEESS
jgi:WLM domain